MERLLYRYQFAPAVVWSQIESMLALSVLAAENLHGESQFKLDASHYLESASRSCVIDASSTVGRDLNRLFTGFLQREIREESFRVDRVTPPGLAGIHLN